VNIVIQKWMFFCWGKYLIYGLYYYKTAYTWNLICLKSKFKIKTTKKQVNKKGATLILA